MQSSLFLTISLYCCCRFYCTAVADFSALLLPFFVYRCARSHFSNEYLQMFAKEDMKYIPSIAFEEMSGSAKDVTAAKVRGRKYIRNRGLRLVIMASAPQSKGVTRAYSKAVSIGAPRTIVDEQIDIMADYKAVHGEVTAAAPKVFLKYFFINVKTGEKSGKMLGEISL